MMEPPLSPACRGQGGLADVTVGPAWAELPVDVAVTCRVAKAGSETRFEWSEIHLMEETEFPFTLPKGYIDPEGTMHRDGVMRLARTFDEIAPKKDPRVASNPQYEVVIRLSRVITRLGTVERIDPHLIENLFSADFAYLIALYDKINGKATEVTCPRCEHCFNIGHAPAKQ